jgi:predicted nuclease of restriction endonuclease-like RecB superfamily
MVQYVSVWFPVWFSMVSHTVTYGCLNILLSIMNIMKPDEDIRSIRRNKEEAYVSLPKSWINDYNMKKKVRLKRLEDKWIMEFL